MNCKKKTQKHCEKRRKCLKPSKSVFDQDSEFRLEIIKTSLKFCYLINSKAIKLFVSYTLYAQTLPFHQFQTQVSVIQL